ncbi:MAG TPA: hypothetical protein VF114_01855, partial [Candidatus Limnocylindria bacterium]
PLEPHLTGGTRRERKPKLSLTDHAPNVTESRHDGRGVLCVVLGTDEFGEWLKGSVVILGRRPW